MFGAFSKLFKKSEPAPAPARSTDQKHSARAASLVPNDETLAKIAVSRRASAAPATAADGLSIPYAAIIKLIPQELWGKLAPAGVAGCNYTISRKSVLEQLPHGSVKVSFGELRRGAPSGVFVNTAAEDGRLVDLPLSEILDLLHPDALSRKPDQVRVEVSEEVPDLFGAKGERLAPLRVMEKKEVSTSTIFRQNPPTKPAKPAAQSATPEAPIPSNITPLPQVKPPTPAPRSVAAAPAAPAPAIKMPSAPAAVPVPKPKPVPAPVNPPVARPLATAPSVARSSPAALPKAAAPKPPAPVAVPAQAAFGAASFLIQLDIVAEAWPDGVRQELAQLKLPDAKIALPPVDICEGLKRGRIQYPWRTLRSWLQPAPYYATPSPHDDLVLELPLRTLTPLFLEFIRANPVNRQAADASNITEFFRRAEQATGTSADLLEPLPDATPLAPAFEQASAPAAPVSGGFAEATVENGAFCLPLALITAHLPEPTTHDVASFNLGGSRFEIPLASIEAGLKAGRIEFSWRELCGWINPPSNPAQVSINGEHRVTLPLGLIAPLFMKSRAGAQVKNRKAVDESIPDLFSAAGQPLVQPTPAEEPAAAPVHASEPVAAAAPKKVPTNLSELFGEPDKKTWTPNEIVQRAAKLPGVAGALIALQDGLLVAGHMPPEIKCDTIAAFVPQIFGRMNQYSRELQMGDTKAVSLAVDPGTIQVYNAGIVYFAALGKDATLLPLAELQLIAAELSRHTK